MSEIVKCRFCKNSFKLDERSLERCQIKVLEDHEYEEYLHAELSVVSCTNNDCRKKTVEARLLSYESVFDNEKEISNYEFVIHNKYTLYPVNYVAFGHKGIPEHIYRDYKEACLIRKLSPNGSAILSRRCLQTIVKHLWPEELKGKEKKPLGVQLSILNKKIDDKTYNVFNSIKNAGNIGAHLDKNADNIAINIGEKEADLIIILIEILLNKFYISDSDITIYTERLNTAIKELT